MMTSKTTLFALLAGLGLSAGTAQAQSTVITANPYLGTPISQYDSRVSPYSPDGAKNKYTTSGGRVYAADGTYLGKLNANKYDAESVANPYGKYGSKYSSTSVNNPYSTYGSTYSSQSATNPYTTTPPRVYYGTSAPAAKAAPSSTSPYTYTPPCYYNCKP